MSRSPTVDGLFGGALVPDLALAQQYSFRHVARACLLERTRHTEVASDRRSQGALQQIARRPSVGRIKLAVLAARGVRRFIEAAAPADDVRSSKVAIKKHRQGGQRRELRDAIGALAAGVSSPKRWPLS